MSRRRAQRWTARGVLLLSCWSSCCASSWPSSLARAQGASSAAMTEASAVRLAEQHNPTLRAALLQLRSAQLQVQSEEDRYAPLLTLDAGLTHTAQPFLIADGTAISRTSDAQAGVAASKRAWRRASTCRGAPTSSSGSAAAGSSAPATRCSRARPAAAASSARATV